jgi:hypothetical protein
MTTTEPAYTDDELRTIIDVEAQRRHKMSGAEFIELALEHRHPDISGDLAMLARIIQPARDIPGLAELMNTPSVLDL